MATKSPAHEDWRELLDQAEECLQEGDFDAALPLCDRAALHGDEARYHAVFLRGDILLELGDVLAALSCYDSIASPEIPDPAVDCARGITLFELGRLPEAENALRSALRGDPDSADAHHTLGLIAELLGTGEEVECFRQARRLDPERYPSRPPLAPETFEAIVDAALAELPKEVRDALQAIPVLIAELPHLEDLRKADPPLSPTVLGMFVGVPPQQASLLDAPPAESPAILLFKRNLERAFADADELAEEIRITVIHEVGHALGLSEDELYERGLE